ncbi:response regulator [Shinella kummerowiae]|jgi:hypothetical protein|uniref:response regulator n=1 Tax=Shinella kummerowiae TaxID=417745 RepID=UPI001FE59057|nr:response regulator [Shinella kummerowiae]
MAAGDASFDPPNDPNRRVMPPHCGNIAGWWPHRKFLPHAKDMMKISFKFQSVWSSSCSQVPVATGLYTLSGKRVLVRERHDTKGRTCVCFWWTTSRQWLRRIIGVLTKRGNIVDHVPTIEQAREAMKMGVHETVLLDRQLPDGDGITLLSEMRRNADTTPVILADRA